MSKLYTCSNRGEKQEIIDFIKEGKYPDDLNKDQKRAFRRKAGNFKLLGDDLCFKGKDSLLKVVFEYEEDLILHILKTEHNPAHIGINKMVALINQKYYGISKVHITEYVKSCDACKRFNSLRTIQPVYINDITRKFDRFIIDCVDLRRYTNQNDGFCWILNVIDTFTKYLWSFNLKNKTAIEVKNSLEYIFKNYGTPLSIQADNGKEFRNNLLHEYLNNLNILVIHGRPRNPKSQGQVERVNQTVKRWLAKKVHGTGVCRWIDFHTDIIYYYNTTIHRATGKSPFLLFHGHQGFNNPLSGGTAYDGQNGLEMNTVDIQEPDTIEVIYDNWDLIDISDDVPTAMMPIANINNDILITPLNEKINDEVLDHFSKYKQKVIENCDSNLATCIFSIGNEVLIRRDFDMNPSTKRQSFESFFEKSIYRITNILNNNMLELVDVESGEFRTVFKGKVKKN